MRMNSKNDDDSLSESFWEQQEKLKRQMHAVELLEAEFLRFLWTEQPASPAQLGERFDRFAEVLDKTGGLDAGAVLALFAKLEQRAFREINKPLALAQTIDPERIAQQCPDLPRVVVENSKAVHAHAFTTGKSKQSKQANDARNKAHRDMEAAALDDWEKFGRNVSTMSAFARARHKDFGVTERTLCKWISDHQKSKA